MLHLDHDTLLKQVQRQNRHAERDRLAARDAVESKIADLEIAADACRNTMQRLRGARGKGSDYELALHRRDEVLREIESLKTSLDPSTELVNVSSQMDAASRKQRVLEDEDAVKYVSTAKMVGKTLHPALEQFPHPKGWNFDPDTGDVIIRHRTPLPESNLSLLKLEWTRFDFKPKVPWRAAAANELQTVADGLLTYHTKKSDRMERHARASRQRLISSGNSRGSPRSNNGGTSRSSRTGGKGGFEGAGFDANSSFGPRPTSAINLVSGSNSPPIPNSRPTTRPMSGPGGIVLMPIEKTSPPSSSSSFPHHQSSSVIGLPVGDGHHSLHLNVTQQGLVNTKRLSPVPSATVKRRQITLRPIPQEFLDSLSPEQLRKPLHPAYLLSSTATHDKPWKKPDPKGQNFSSLPADKAPTANEILRAKQYIVPDRSFYNAREEGKPEFLKPDPHPYPIFSSVPANSAWLQMHGREEDKELQKRFYAQIAAQNNYQGEDAFNGPTQSSSLSPRSTSLGTMRSLQLTHRDTTRGLPPTHHVPDEVRASSRERLHTNHPLGFKAVESAAREHTTRMLSGANTKAGSGRVGGSNNNLVTTIIPEGLFKK